MSKKKKKAKKSKNNAVNAAESANKKHSAPVKTYITSPKSQVTYDNTSDNIIMITVSKARLIYRDQIQNRADSSTIWSWFGAALSCFIAVVSSNFERTKALHESFPVVLTLGFIVGCIYSFVVTVKCIIRFFKNKARYTEETFIAELKLKRDVADTVDADSESPLSELASIWHNK